MATVNSSQTAAGAPRKSGHGAGPVFARGTFAIPATGDGTVANDVIEMVKVPNGARVLDVVVVIDDVDTNGTPTHAFTVGDGADADRYITSSTVGQTGGVVRMNAATADFTYTADDTIDITVGTASATKAAGTVTMTVLYSTTGD